MYGNSQDNVEFIHPKLREEMPDNGEGGDPDNPWVWLTSYSRIPVFHTFIWSNMQLSVAVIVVISKANFLIIFSWKQYKIFVLQLKNIALRAKKERKVTLVFQVLVG